MLARRPRAQNALRRAAGFPAIDVAAARHGRATARRGRTRGVLRGIEGMRAAAGAAAATWVPCARARRLEVPLEIVMRSSTLLPATGLESRVNSRMAADP